MLAGLDVSVPANTQILTIDYTAGSDAVAVRRAQGFAEAYLDFRKARSEDVTRAKTERIQSQINAQNKSLSEPGHPGQRRDQPRAARPCSRSRSAA